MNNEMLEKIAEESYYDELEKIAAALPLGAAGTGGVMLTGRHALMGRARGAAQRAANIAKELASKAKGFKSDLDSTILSGNLLGVKKSDIPKGFTPKSANTFAKAFGVKTKASRGAQILGTGAAGVGVAGLGAVAAAALLKHMRRAKHQGILGATRQSFGNLGKAISGRDVKALHKAKLALGLTGGGAAGLAGGAILANRD